MYFNVNFNVFFKLIKLHLLVSELYLFFVICCALQCDRRPTLHSIDHVANNFCATCPANLILMGLTVVTIFGDTYIFYATLRVCIFFQLRYIEL